MADYLEEFFRTKLLPYKAALEGVPLEYRLSVAEDVRVVLVESVDAGTLTREPTFPAALDDRLRLIYALTAQIGYDFGRLLARKSGPCLRIGEDYIIVYSEIMALFGKDKDMTAEALFDVLRPQIQRDRILRSIGIEPKHVLAWLN